MLNLFIGIGVLLVFSWVVFFSIVHQKMRD